MVLDQQALGAQLVDDHVEQGVVRALTGHVVVGEEDPQHAVDLVDVPQALGHEDLPEPQRLGVSPLEQHHPLATALAECGVAVEVEARLGIELVEITHAEGLGGGGAAHVDQVLDQHAERRAPVPDVVLPQYLVAQEARGPGPGSHRSPCCAGDRRAFPWPRWGSSSRSPSSAGWRVTATPRRASALTAATWSATKASDRVRLMKPGPLTSTTAQRSSSEAAATTSAATCWGERPTDLASGSAPLAWKSARSDARRTGSAPGRSCRMRLGGVEGER